MGCPLDHYHLVIWMVSIIHASCQCLSMTQMSLKYRRSNWYEAPKGPSSWKKALILLPTHLAQLLWPNAETMPSGWPAANCSTPTRPDSCSGLLIPVRAAFKNPPNIVRDLMDIEWDSWLRFRVAQELGFVLIAAEWEWRDWFDVWVPFWIVANMLSLSLCSDSLVHESTLIFVVSRRWFDVLPALDARHCLVV